MVSESSSRRRRPCPGSLSVGSAAAARAAAGDVVATSSSDAAATSGESRCGVASRPPRWRKHSRWGRSSGLAVQDNHGLPARPRLAVPVSQAPSGVGVTTTLRGPERVFRFRIAKRVANAGVVITQHGSGVRVEPRVVAGARREPPHRATPVCRSTAIRTWTASTSRCSLPASSHRCARRVRRRLRQRVPRARRGCVHVPLLDQRRA